MAKETVIESESIALETIKELFKVGVTFACQKLLDDQGQSKGRLIVIYDTDHVYADDSSGQPSEFANPELLGRVLVAREADMRQKQEEESNVNATGEGTVEADSMTYPARLRLVKDSETCVLEQTK